jgi:hypothetical protein
LERFLLLVAVSSALLLLLLLNYFTFFSRVKKKKKKKKKILLFVRSVAGREATRATRIVPNSNVNQSSRLLRNRVVEGTEHQHQQQQQHRILSYSFELIAPYLISFQCITNRQVT